MKALTQEEKSLSNDLALGHFMKALEYKGEDTAFIHEAELVFTRVATACAEDAEEEAKNTDDIRSTNREFKDEFRLLYLVRKIRI